MGALFKALQVRSHTLVGVDTSGFPVRRGNCFSVEGDDGQEYRVVNFAFENLEELQRRGLRFPIQCENLGRNRAIVQDPRIGERWYADRYCEVCCPNEMLPCNQRDVYRRQEMSGERSSFGGCTTIRFTVKREFP